VTNRVRFGCLIALLLATEFDLRLLPRASGQTPANLAAFPMQVEGWSGRNVPALTANEERALAADSYIVREYDRSASSEPVVLFVAYYASQRSGDAIHSPKNCLPGAGWAPVSSEVLHVADNADTGSYFYVNHYVIEKDGVQQDVLYWYQAGRRKFASEYLGKIYLAWDAATKGRTDGALIRVTTSRSSKPQQSLETLLKFERAFEPALSDLLRG
jgi:EpsI family protein